MANNKVNKNRHEIEITIDKERWSKAVNEAFKKIIKNVSVDGFRKGKVPKEVFDKKYGKQDYLIEAANKMVEEEFKKIMIDEKYNLVADPQIHLEKLEEDELKFKMTLIEQPEVNVKKYKGLGVKKESTKVTDDEVEHELGHLLERYAELVVKEGDTVENGDTAVIDFKGMKDGVAFDGGTAENYPLEIGSNSFIPGFEEQVIGMKINEEKDINVTFPEEYHVDDLKGQPVIFKVKVNEIKVKQNRELDKDFFEDLGIDGVDSEEKLKNKIKEEIEHQKEHATEEKFVQDILEALGKNTEVDIPEEMVFDVTDRMFNDFLHNLEHQGINFEMYKTYTGQTEEVLRSQMEKEAFNRVLYRLALEKVKELENISITDKEIDAEIKKMADTYKVDEEEVIKQIGSKDMLKYDLEMNKVLEFLKENN